MTVSIEHIVTDIEGTTSSIAFVHETLFPYARQHMHAFLEAHADDPEVRAQTREVVKETGCADTVDAVNEQLLAWMDADRKATPLKALQGMIWATGYADGALHGHVYPDTAPWLRSWRDAGIALYVYSSGSVAAQKLIFGHSTAGDLSGLFSGFFDTRIGGKREVESYRHIVSEISASPSSTLFLSDIGAELDAAAAAGMQTCQLLRDAMAEPAPGHPQAIGFADVEAQFGLTD